MTILQHYAWKGSALLTDLTSYDSLELSGSWFVIHDDVLNFDDEILCYHEPFAWRDKIKINGIINGYATYK